MSTGGTADGGVQTFFRDARTEIAAWLTEFLDGRARAAGNVNAWGPDVFGRLEEFALRGKMLRGGLVLLASRLFAGERHADALKTAAAMELFQSSFLIHDDIMDRDHVRRGAPSFYYRYAGLVEERGVRDGYHLGESFGICGGMIAVFAGYEAIAGIEAPREVLSRLLGLVSGELQAVGVAQMEDVYLGESPETAAEEQILRLYRFKTARYTFSLPLAAGAVLERAPADAVQCLEGIGERLGVIFQIKDDDLGLYGEEEDIGKPVGSDIKENKQTLLRRRLVERATPEERMELDRMFGNPDAGAAEAAYVRTLVDRYGIRDSLDRMARDLAAEAEREIDRLEVAAPEHKEILSGLVTYSLGRKR